ncbi:DUF2742 domain-containing protein [Mycobacterium simiae]|uniref:DUF2742 domain-containing protein n=1 Tax=Mycobacterium simiae TaxID=1784 RepID=UPI0009DB7DFF|nr:DUF2742 domain-containing protein [Mycobacterium simiae]
MNGPPQERESRPGYQAAPLNPTSNSDLTAPSSVSRSQQASWWSVHEFVTAVLDQVNDWPMAGTPAWCSLAHDDPRKWAALLDAAQHFALRVETCQVAECLASRAVSAAASWADVAHEQHQRQSAIAVGTRIDRRPPA